MLDSGSFPSAISILSNVLHSRTRHLDRVCKLIDADPHRGQELAQDFARGILDGEVELVTRKNWPNGCLMMQGALATSPDSEPIARMMADMRGMAEGWIRDRLKRAVKEGDLPVVS